MYINPFWAGVAACILVEVGLIIVAAITVTIKKKRGRDGK